MTDFDALLSFIRACVADDRNLAGFASDPDNDWWWNQPESLAEQHIARWSPKAVLAHCDATDAILAEHNSVPRSWDEEADTCRTCGVLSPCPTLLALAQPFAGRDGWRQEWAAE